MLAFLIAAIGTLGPVQLFPGLADPPQAAPFSVQGNLTPFAVRLRGDSIPRDSARASHSSTSTSGQLPGIPRAPELVSVLQFDMGRGQTGQILFAAEIDGRRGTFLLDTGSPLVILNAQYIRPTPTKGVDTLIEGETGATKEQTLVSVHTVRIGTLLHRFDSTHVESATPFKSNAAILKDPRLHGFTRPVLGFLGIPALAPFETIIDYTHKRLILIRLDSAGRRMVDVPAYTPATTLPLVVYGQHYGVIAHVGEESDTLMVDTGTSWSEMTKVTRQQFKTYATKPPAGEEGGWRLYPPAFGFPGNTVVWKLDHMTLGNRTYDGVLFSPSESPGGLNDNILGYSFLRQHGVIGFNLRTRQLISYR